MQRCSSQSARPVLTIALALLLQLSLSVFTSAGVPAAVAAATTLTLVSEPGDAWSDAAGSSGGAVLTYGHGGCGAVDGDGFCTSGLWAKLPGAHWIWRSQLPTPDEAANGSPVITFTKTFSLPPNAAGASGTIRVAADNSYQLYLNGVLLGQDGDWPSIETYSISPVPGDNTIEVKAVNAGGGSTCQTCNPGGVLYRADISFQAVTVVAPPTTSAQVSPAPNLAGWSNGDVTVALSASDGPNGSGVGSITYSAAGAQPMPATTVNGATAAFGVTAEGQTTITYYATDNAGNAEAPKTLTVLLDKTAPTIAGSRSPAANASGWNNTYVTVSFTCADSRSGVASCSGPTTLTAAGANQSVTGTASDNAGNGASATVGGINIDKTPPVVTYAGNAGSYTLAQTVSITCTAADSLSGVASSTCQNISGPAYSFSGGQNTFSATATDKAGNSGGGSTSFTVQATYAGLCDLTQQLVTKPGVTQSLCAKLAAAESAAVRGNAKAKANILEAYRNEVAAQTGKSITAANAALLIRLAGML